MLLNYLQCFSDVVVIAVSAVAGNQFAEEACKEELESKQDSNECEVE